MAHDNLFCFVYLFIYVIGFVGNNSGNGKHVLFTHKSIVVKFNKDQVLLFKIAYEFYDGNLGFFPESWYVSILADYSCESHSRGPKAFDSWKKIRHDIFCQMDSN